MAAGFGLPQRIRQEDGSREAFEAIYQEIDVDGSETTADDTTTDRRDDGGDGTEKEERTKEGNTQSSSSSSKTEEWELARTLVYERLKMDADGATRSIWTGLCVFPIGVR